jgi:hypothetical protein
MNKTLFGIFFFFSKTRTEGFHLVSDIKLIEVFSLPMSRLLLVDRISNEEDLDI